MKKANKYIKVSNNPITNKPNERKRYASENYGNHKKHNPSKRSSGSVNISDKKLQKVLEHTRFKGAKKIKGYVFTGSIPIPKDDKFYLPTNTSHRF